MDNSGILYVGRIPAYDIAKGIGILLVVLGHVTYVRYDVFLSIVICLLTCLIMVPFVYIINRYAKIVFGKS